MNLALSWAKEATAMCMQALAVRVALRFDFFLLTSFFLLIKHSIHDWNDLLGGCENCREDTRCAIYQTCE